MKTMTTVYDASNQDRIGIGAWKVMFRELYDFRELIGRLVKRNLAAQVRQSFLGYVWIVLPPIAVTIVFTLLRQANLINIPEDANAMPYGLFALVGVTIWGAFSEFTNAGLNSIFSGGALVSKVYFPREVLALSKIGMSAVNLMIRIAVILLTFALTFYLPKWQIIFVPVVLLPMIAFAIGLGLLLAPINTMMTDMSRVVAFAFQFGTFITPAIFPTPKPDAIQGGYEALIYWVHVLNPVSHFINGARDLLHTGAWPLNPGYAVASILGVLTLAVGWRFFHICEPLLAERL
jgi:lipopolysaccharide transport system permease protein